MDPFDGVIRALRMLIARSGHQLGQVIVLTENNVPETSKLIDKLDEQGHGQLIKRIRDEVVGAGKSFHTVIIKFPGIGAYEMPLDEPDDESDTSAEG